MLLGVRSTRDIGSSRPCTRLRLALRCSQAVIALALLGLALSNLSRDTGAVQPIKPLDHSEACHFGMDDSADKQETVVSAAELTKAVRQHAVLAKGRRHEHDSSEVCMCIFTREGIIDALLTLRDQHQDRRADLRAEVQEIDRKYLQNFEADYAGSWFTVFALRKARCHM